MNMNIDDILKAEDRMLEIYYDHNIAGDYDCYASMNATCESRGYDGKGSTAEEAIKSLVANYNEFIGKG